MARWRATEVRCGVQGAQFTGPLYTEKRNSRGVAIGMDGRGRALDNVFIERLWRSVKYEDIYLKRYETGRGNGCRE